MIKVGICGLGFMGRTHFGVYRDHPDADVVAWADQDRKRSSGDWSDTIGNLPGTEHSEPVNTSSISTYDSFRELISDPHVELVDICAPTDMHAELSLAALRAGKHVLCEKPMALSCEDCDRVAAQVGRSKGMFMVAQCIRFWPAYATIHDCVCTGQYGPIRSVALRRLASAPGYSFGGWLMDHTRSGGAIFDLHVHDVDYALYLMGRPQRVFAQGTKGPSGGIDHVDAQWDYGDGRIVSIEGGWCFHEGFRFQMIVSVRCQSATFEWQFGRDDHVTMYRDGFEPEKILIDPSNGWQREIDYFLNCIKTGQPPEIVTARSSAESIALVAAERESIDAGRIITVA